MFNSPDFGRVSIPSHNRRAPGPIGIHAAQAAADWWGVEWWAEDGLVSPNCMNIGEPFALEEEAVNSIPREPAGIEFHEASEQLETTSELGVPWIQDRSGDAKTMQLTKKKKDGTSYRVRPRGRFHHVESLVLHQTAVRRSDANDPNARTYSNIGAHFVVTPIGDIILLHPLDRHVWHAQGLSKNSVSVEFEGNFPDVEGSWWEDPKRMRAGKRIQRNHVSREQIDAGRRIVHFLMSEGRPDFVDLKHIFAHRQSSGNRTNDPGPDIWYHVAEWAFQVYPQLNAGPRGYRVQTGKPIPDEWRQWGKPLSK